MHWPGIEPGPPAWQARILPLNHQCLHAQCGSGKENQSLQGLRFFCFSSIIRLIHFLAIRFALSEHACLCLCVFVRSSEFVCVCLCVRVHVCARGCVYVLCVHACARVCTHARVHVCLHVFTPLFPFPLLQCRDSIDLVCSSSYPRPSRTCFRLNTPSELRSPNISLFSFSLYCYEISQAPSKEPQC